MKVLAPFVILVMFFLQGSSLPPPWASLHAAPLPAPGLSVPASEPDPDGPTQGQGRSGGRPAPSYQAQANGNCQSPYIIRPGETLGGIARRCGVTIAAIMMSNPQVTNIDLIFDGQQLTIPGAAAAPAAPPAADQSQSGSSGSTSTEKSIPVTGDRTHVVRQGDTLAQIASSAGLSVNQLMWANKDILNPDRIMVGQTVRIPAPGTAPETYRWETDRAQNLIVQQLASGQRYQPQSGSEHWILVDLATQTVVAMEGSQMVRSFVVSTGTYRYPTVTGTYRIWTKLRYDDMSGPGYYLKDVPYVMYFHKGYGLHGTYWHSTFGTPMSHGCVNLTVADSAWLFDFAQVGTVVDVQ